MSTVYVNLSMYVSDDADALAAENEIADELAHVVGTDPRYTSASFTGNALGMVNLFDRFANLSANEPAEHPKEAGPAAAGIGVGEAGVGNNRPAKRVAKSRKRPAARR